MGQGNSSIKNTDGIAIIGMAGKFPGAENIYQFWEAISEGKELLKRFSDEELKKNGVDENTKKHKYFVPVNGLIHTAEYFDSSFFGFTPREADLTDPQHRKFLEVCYEALEHAGVAPDNPKGSVGVFAGCSMNNYLLKNLLQYPELLRNNGEFQTIVNNDKDFLTTKVSYKLNLTGPSFDIQTACSTSLVAIHVACQNLLNYQCDIAMGGGAFIMNPRGHGYMFKPGGIESSNGNCKPFDEGAEGTVFGEGVGVVILKRLEDAIADKDEIWAVIKSSAINNDGSNKIGYMAPSSEGQADAISMAMQFGSIDARTISYVEAHGTGTNLGDPIEISGLTKVYRKYTQDKNYCAIGSVKGNIGHCDVAAGVVGIIKTAMALKYKKLPPTINFSKANPELELDTSPFYVNTKLKEWDTEYLPRRAALSSFGIGGTNAHCVLEEWDNIKSIPSENEVHLLPLTAKNVTALDQIVTNTVNHIGLTKQNIADIAHTLQTGRNYYQNRTLLLGRNLDEITENFKKTGLAGVVKGKQQLTDPSVIFMFTGQGSQYVNMAKGLYGTFDVYRNIVDEGHELLKENFNIDLLELLFQDSKDEEYRAKINLTSNTQPVLFVVQYATACLLIEFGIFPNALIGHSIGEITAATLSGVFSFDEALNIVARRGEIMQAQKSGSMLSVNLSAEKLKPYLTNNIELALQNAPDYSVVSGTNEAIAIFEKELNNKIENLHTTILKTSHAFHSSLMDPALNPFKEVLEGVEFNGPEIPFISNVTGTWITLEEACSKEYWANHIRSTVLFADGIMEIFRSEDEAILLEVGPGNTLSMLVSQFEVDNNFKCISTIRHPRTNADDVQTFYNAVSNFWVCGGNLDWEAIYTDEKRYKVPLPTYPFDQKRHWIDPQEFVNIYADAIHSNKAPKNLKVEDEHSKVVLPFSNQHNRPELDVDYVEPSSETEKLVVSIWQELLGICRIGIKDDFFDLGGHSLLASQLIVRINENFNVKLPLDSIFNSPTVDDLITKWNLIIGETSIEKSAKSEFFPLSNEQQRLWLINTIDGNNPSYNIPFTYRLKGSIDVEVLNSSFQVLTERHKALKTYIITKEDNPVCGIRKESFSINVVDFAHVDKAEQEVSVQQYLEEDIRTVFDLTKDPLIRATILQLADDEHVFHLTVQHLVFDGWSWGIFSKELSQIYNDLLSGSPISLPEIDIQYFDFSNWQNNNQSELNNPKSLEFWKEQLKDIPTETKFPYDHKRPDKITGLGGRENISIDESLTKKLKSISNDTGSTLFMTMLTAFGTLINIYSKQNDVCIGTPTGNRTRSAFEKIIGFFVNTVVFRLKYDKSTSFREILVKNRKVVIDSLQHQNVSFEKLVEVIQPQRIMNINPIFQIMFAWQNAPRPQLQLNGIKGERLVVINGISPLDITFYMWEEKGEILGEIEYNSDLLNRETIIHLKHNFIHLLSDISTNLDKPINELSANSQYSLVALENFNKTQTELPHKLLHELFEDSAKKYPSKIAVVSGKSQLSYKELNNRANKLAHNLIKLNVKDSFIGVSLQRNEEMLVAVLAILKSGANYLPLDPEFPDDRLKYILKDSGAKLLITTKNLKMKFDGISTEMMLLGDDSKLDFHFFSKAYENPNLEISKSALAYTIYTSGSTGNPKGVKVQHSAAVNFILSMAKRPGISPDDKLLAVTTLSFDISVLELFLPISIGATVVIARSEEVSNGSRIIDLIEIEKVNMMQATPATWNVLLLNGWKGDSNLVALCGGEAIQPELIKNLLPKVGKLWNMYGPTETTVWSTCHQITDVNSPVLVGKPIDNTQIIILDDNKKEIPLGIYGEVCIGGEGVTVGYHNKKQLTKDKFINYNKQIIYRTGDSGRILSNGQLELSGRLDHQIKLRGFRIEPGEIETLIAQEPGVKEVIVKVLKFEDLDERLIAFLSCVTDKNIDVKGLKSKLKINLPAYMVPSDFVVMEEFPKTPNGKIDRNSLTYKKQDNPVETNKENIQTSDIELMIMETWKNVLRAGSIDLNDNFFDIGGNSLTLTKVANEVNKKLNEAVDIAYFFEYPTIKLFSDFIVNKESKSNKNSEPIRENRRRMMQLGQRRR